MKKFVLAVAAVMLLSLSSFTKAEVIATMKTQIGKMFLTDDKCATNAKAQKGFVLSGVTAKLDMCWSYNSEDDEIYVLYSDGDIRMYPGEAFTVNTSSKLYKKTQEEEEGVAL